LYVLFCPPFLNFFYPISSGIPEEQGKLLELSAAFGCQFSRGLNQARVENSADLRAKDDDINRLTQENSRLVQENSQQKASIELLETRFRDLSDSYDRLLTTEVEMVNQLAKMRSEMEPLLRRFDSIQ
jgi:hypothetical protein